MDIPEVIRLASLAVDEPYDVEVWHTSLRAALEGDAKRPATGYELIVDAEVLRAKLQKAREALARSEERLRLFLEEHDADVMHFVELSETAEERLRVTTDALRKIAEWDCLNPPDAHILGDLPWLKRLVDDALARAGGAS